MEGGSGSDGLPTGHRLSGPLRLDGCRNCPGGVRKRLTRQRQLHVQGLRRGNESSGIRKEVLTQHGSSAAGAGRQGVGGTERQVGTFGRALLALGFASVGHRNQ